MLLILLALLILGFIIFFFSSFIPKKNRQIQEPIFEPSGKCCGAHSVCEQDTLLSSSNIISYYNDVDLDVLAGISPVNFTDEQLKLLSDVFFSLKESDTAGWLRSLQMRNIQLPVELREQALLIVSERRIA
jgi:hypothetical protein